MGKLKNKKRKNISTQKDPFREKGITLIALVVTIIVLLILAGISIAMLTGNDGIIQKAIEAKDATRAGAVQEKINMIIAENLISEYSDGERRTREEVIQELQEEENLTLEEVSELEDKNIIQIGNMNVDFSGLMTLTQMYNKAIAEGCTNENGTCTDETHLHAGDYVNYKAPTTGSYTVKADTLGVDYDQTYDVSYNPLNWRVLGINPDTGNLKLIAGSPMKKTNSDGTGVDEASPYLRMIGSKSYTNSIEELNQICSLYTTNLGAARSITQEDIDQITGITSEDEIKRYNLDPYYNGKNYGDSYSFANAWTPEAWIENNGTTSENLGNTVAGNVTGYYYAVNHQDSAGGEYVTLSSDKVYDMLFDETSYNSEKKYWLASTAILANDNYAFFGPGMVYHDGTTTIVGTPFSMFDTSGGGRDDSAAVRPVVVLSTFATGADVRKITTDVTETW